MTNKPARSLKRYSVLAIAVGAASFSAGACGPPLTDPGPSDISGQWFATGPAAGLTNVTMVLKQETNGSLSGTYVATGRNGLQFCPSSGPCVIRGTITGSNTVFQIFFELSDAGQFTGQLVTDTELNGSMNRVNTTQPILFTKS
jgi:hypothetical protein